MISIYTLIAYIIWTVMFVVWMVGRIESKETQAKLNTSKYLLLYFSYVLLFVPPLFNWRLVSNDRFFGLFGDAICLLAAGLAIWARIVLGKNWSAGASQKIEHDLIQTGPYSLVRHPIYLGLVLAMFGFSLTIRTPLSYSAVLVGLISILLRIPIEEKLMGEIFTTSHKEYSRKIKKLIPFVW